MRAGTRCAPAVLVTAPDVSGNGLGATNLGDQVAPFLTEATGAFPALP
ncbi:MAG: hypothetical protein AB1416_02685 [Actinomycetota bacterium]